MADEKLTVLLVEDDESHVELVRRSFERSSRPYVLSVANSLNEAHDILGKRLPMILFVDWILPDGHGTEILEDSRSANFPVVVMTSHGDQKLAAKAIKLGALDYIVKSTNSLLNLPQIADFALREWQEKQARKLLELELLNAQRLESVGQLAGGIAHDFNNLLTVIMGYTKIMLYKMKPDDPFMQYAVEIKKAGERANGVVNQLLTFARKNIFNPRILKINRVVIDTQKMLKHMIGEDIDFKVHLCDDLGHVKMDLNQLQQVLVNLAVNARDAMPHGGKLTIETQNVMLQESDRNSFPDMTPGEYVMLSFSDNGIGMSQKTQGRVFEPFFTTKEVGKGTGLGLSTVHGIVRQHGGHIRIQSKVGHGTTFELYFPRSFSVEEHVSEEKCPQDNDVAGKESLLLVEDDDAIRKLLTAAIEEKGYTVYQAKNGEDALKKFNNGHPQVNLVISDIIMPKMGGLEMADCLNRTHPETKFIFMSGYSEKVLSERSYFNKKHYQFVPKPCDVDVLLNKVRASFAE